MNWKTLNKITSRDIATRLFLSSDGVLFDCTAQGHDRFALQHKASIKTGWIRLVFVSDKYSGQRLVVESKKANESQHYIIAMIISLSKVKTVSLYDVNGDETRIVSATAEKYMNEVNN